MSTPFAKLVAASLRRERFTLVDVGCAGGIEPAWRVFGDAFRAVGFDASISECRQLTSTEAHPDVKYISGFVDIPPTHPFAVRDQGKPDYGWPLFNRFSAAWAMEFHRERLKTASAAEKRDHNAWNLTELADPSKRLFVPEVLEQHGYTDVDLMKIDIDGPDFRVLNSFDGLFDEFRILALRLEVNFIGRGEDSIHTFHNTDKFMRQRGYDLFALDTRCYSSRALPAKFTTTTPAQTVTGRTFQGDAYYARDAASLHQREQVASLGAEKLAKLAAILSIWHQPDGAAELLLTFRDTLCLSLDVDKALDLLAAQIQHDAARPLSYDRYMTLFASDSPDF